MWAYKDICSLLKWILLTFIERKKHMYILKNILFILLVVVCFALGFVSGCQTVHGLCADGKTAFNIAEKVTRPLAEKQDELDSKMAEDNLHGQLSKAEKGILEAHMRAERFARVGAYESRTAQDAEK